MCHIGSMCSSHKKVMDGARPCVLSKGVQKEAVGGGVWVKGRMEDVPRTYTKKGQHLFLFQTTNIKRITMYWVLRL